MSLSSHIHTSQGTRLFTPLSSVSLKFYIYNKTFKISFQFSIYRYQDIRATIWWLRGHLWKLSKNKPTKAGKWFALILTLTPCTNLNNSHKLSDHSVIRSFLHFRFAWERTTGSQSQVHTRWTVPTTAVNGNYRFNHYGYYKNIDGTIVEYSGTTKTFAVKLFIFCVLRFYKF